MVKNSEPRLQESEKEEGPPMRKVGLSLVAVISIALLSSCTFWPFSESNDYQADAQMERIVAAINQGDAAALKELFSPTALDEAEGLEDGLAYFLSFFPEGGVTWKRDTVNSEIERESGKRTELLHAYYQISAGGKDYVLYFADFTVNDLVDPDNVGLYALGVIPWASDIHSGPAEPFFKWSASIHIDENDEEGYAGVYVPE